MKKLASFLIVLALVLTLASSAMAEGEKVAVICDPVGTNMFLTQAVDVAKELQKRFSGKFGALRCQDLLRNKSGASDATPAAQRLGLTGHCDIMIVTAVEIVEELLAERA